MSIARIRRFVVPVLTVLVFCVPAVAEDYEWVGATGADWDNVNHWILDPSGDPAIAVPGPNDQATIRANDYCHVRTVDQDIGILIVEGAARLSICSERTLTLHDDSTVDGLVQFGCKTDLMCDGDTCQVCVTPILELAASVSITGAGGRIESLCFDGEIVAASASNAVLTIGPSGSCSQPCAEADVVTIDPHNIHTIEIKTELVNNGRVGCSDESVCELILSTEDKRGCGTWFARNGGVLTVNVAVSGTGAWILETTDSFTTDLSEIVINTDCTVAGDVDIKSGLLDVVASFCTIGGLRYDALSSNAVIKVAAGQFASFGATCP